MGRQAHLIRLALGRSADLPPDWDAVKDQYERIEGEGDAPPHYRCIDSSNLVSYGKTFDEKGRPLNIRMRSLDEQRCKDQNTLLALAISTIDSSHTTPVEYDDVQGEEQIEFTESIQAQTKSVNERRIDPILVACRASPWIHAIGVFALRSFEKRLLVFPSQRSLSLTQQFGLQRRFNGAFLGLFAGLPSAIMSKIYETTALQALKFSLQRWSLYHQVRPLVRQLTTFGLWISLDFFILMPLTTFSWLQSLQILPPSQLLPPLSCFLPLSDTSSTRPRLFSTSARLKLTAAYTINNKITYAVGNFFESMMTDYIDNYRNGRREKPVASPGNSLLSRFRHLLSSSMLDVLAPIFHFVGWSGNSIHGKQTLTGAAMVQSLFQNVALILCDICMEPFTGILLRLSVANFLETGAFDTSLSVPEVSRMDLYPVLPSFSGITTILGFQNASQLIQRLALIYGLRMALDLAEQITVYALIIWQTENRRRADHVD